MSHQLENLLSTYLKQQDEMGIPQVILQSKLIVSETKKSVAFDLSDLPSDTKPETPTPQIQERQPEKVAPVEVKKMATTETVHDTRTVREQLIELYSQVKSCTACALSQSRTKLVFGAGNANADIMIIGEAPGFEEDQQGLPFVGPAGQLLTKMLSAINLDRKEDTFITTALKCRAPGNRKPTSEECVTCLPTLKRQISIIQPKVILLLGKTAAASLLGRVETINQLREENLFYHDIPTFVTFDPADLLRNSSLKRPAWDDLQNVQRKYQELS